jgi:glycosyltransferase involved in cell wall biosynthesis
VKPELVGVLSVIMPVYNEERTLESALIRVLARPEVGEVIAVDDGSRDGSWEILRQLASHDARLSIVRQAPNQGKGAAIRRAIGEIRMPFAIVQDADLELDPSDYPALAEPLVEGRADIVYGVRSLGRRAGQNFWLAIGNRAVTLACNLLFHSRIGDLETGYKALRSDLWKRLNLRGNRFDIEAEITARALRLGYRIHQVPVSYHPRTAREGKKLNWKDGVHAITTLLRLRFRSSESLFGSRITDEYHRNRLQELAHAQWLSRPEAPELAAKGARNTRE